MSVRVHPLTVDAHARCDDEALDRTLRQRLEQNSRAEVIDRRIACYLVHALPNANGSGQVVYAIYAVKGPAYGVRVPHIAFHQLPLGVELRRPATFRAMHLRGQDVECANAMAVGKELVAEPGTDEAGAAGDQDGLSHALAPDERQPALT